MTKTAITKPKETMPDGSQPLTNNRQELFCQYLSAGESKTQAYIKAGYKDTSTAVSNSQHLSRRHHVLQRFTHLKDKIVAEVHEKAISVTKETISAELGEAILKATELGQTSAIVSALALRAKLYGLVTDKVETKDVLPELSKQEEQYQREYAAWRLDQEAARHRHGSGSGIDNRKQTGLGRTNGPAGTIDSPKESIKLYGT